MGRLKLYGIIAGIVLLFLGLRGFYDTLTSEKTPFKTTIEDVEKNGLGNHKYVQITGCIPAGPFVYQYETKLGMKGNVKYILYPVVSEEREMDYYMNDTDENAKLSSKVIVRMDTSFPVSMVNDFAFDTGTITIEGMVRGSIDKDDKDLLNDDALDLESNYVYIVKETPNSNGLNLVITGIGVALIFFVGKSFVKKKDEPAATNQTPPQA